MLRTVTRNSPRNDLPSFRNKIPKDLWVLVIDLQFLIRAKSADLPPQKRFSLSIAHGSPLGSSRRFPHDVLLSSKFTIWFRLNEASRPLLLRTPLRFRGVPLHVPEFRGNDLHAASLDSLRRFPASLVKSTYDHQGLATFEEIEIVFR